MEVSNVDITTEAGADDIYKVWCPAACSSYGLRGRLRNVFQKFETEGVFLEVRVAHQVGGSG